MLWSKDRRKLQVLLIQIALDSCKLILMGFKIQFIEKYVYFQFFCPIIMNPASDGILKKKMGVFLGEKERSVFFLNLFFFLVLIKL